MDSTGIGDSDLKDQHNKILECLNTALAADYDAIAYLFGKCVVSANKALEAHPHVIVGGTEECTTVSPIGLINGVLHAAGIPRIAAMWEDEPDEFGNHKLRGFCTAAAQFTLP